MRYSIVGATVEQVQAIGGTDIKEARSAGIIFATLTEAQVVQLKAMGCQVVLVGKVSTATIGTPVAPPVPVAGIPVYTPLQLTTYAGLERVRAFFSPPLYGKNLNIAIIDTGILETHELINGHVVYSKNFTSEPMRDGFNHGTGVASIIAETAPQCGILNIKVMGDKGEGTEEDAVLGIDDAISLFDTDPDIAPSVINLSLGNPDDGNPSNSIRVACRAAIERGILVIAAAGNSGPDAGSIMSPACEKYVGAVGSVKPSPFSASEWSGRGPTKEGLVKPDAVFFGENIIVASSEGDTSTIAKSGTSFASPFGASLLVLTQEAIMRQVAISYPGVEPTPAWLSQIGIPLTAEKMIDFWMPRIGVKPQEVEAGKDNAYGCGMPWGSFILRELQPAAAAIDFSSMIGLVMLVSMLGMVVKEVR